MIYEYALEPELVASWHDAASYRYFVEQLGFGTGRVVSRYPEEWQKLVWNAFQSAFGATAGQIRQKRIEVLLTQLARPEVNRPGYRWDNASTWLTNAENEHARIPFHAILARSNPDDNSNVIRAEDVISGTAAAWAAPISIPIKRTAESIADCVASMLRCSTKILFVDPYFRAIKPEFNKSLAAFLQRVAGQDSQITVELHTADRDDAPPFSMFKKECETYLPRIVPVGLTLIIRRWRQREGGRGMHNRYILTDIGGVKFGWGFGEGKPGESDDVSLLSVENYRLRLEEYAGPKHAFDLDGEFSLIGKAIKN
jgi:hypothetical protein